MDDEESEVIDSLNEYVLSHASQIFESLEEGDLSEKELYSSLQQSNFQFIFNFGVDMSGLLR